LMYDIYAQAVSTPAKTVLEYNSTVKSLPESSSGRRQPAYITPELHSPPLNFCQRLVTKVQSGGKVFSGCCHSQNPASSCNKTVICVFGRSGMKNLHSLIVNPIETFDNRAFLVFSGIAFIRCYNTSRRTPRPFEFQLPKRLVVHGFKDGK
jgi:hypothetical protein